MNKFDKHGYKSGTRFRGNRTRLRLQLTALILVGMFGVSSAHSAAAGPDIIIPPLAKICYVNWSASGDDDGTSWANAYSGPFGLQNALIDLATSSCQQIWVAKGLYVPGGGRTDTFQLKNGVVLYGGFDGTETSLSDRDILANETLLSGNIMDLDIHTDNIYHVVTGSGTDDTAVLDGFTVAFGYADGDTPDSLGAGLYIDKGNPTIRNVTFKHNYAVRGGGVYNWDSTAGFWGIIFDSNTAVYGGGVYNNTSNIEIENATFVNNTADYNGGAIVNDSSNPTLIHLTIKGNSALGTTGLGGGIFNRNSTPKISNTILWGNTAGQIKGGDQIYDEGTSATKIDHSVVQGGFEGINIIKDNPALGPFLVSQGGRMQVIPIAHRSSARDAADADKCAHIDQRGLNRPQGAGCDIGAYEFQDVIYVVPGGGDSGFCQSWGVACDLQYALKEAFHQTKQQIWVKAGTYKPFAGPDRAATFLIGRGEQIYGGFAGTETSLGQRNYQRYVTTLSGDLNTTAKTDNSYHVVTNKECLLETTDDGLALVTILDGFTITGGYADGKADDGNGGGIYASGCAVLNHLIITDNFAANQGGGVWNGDGGLSVGLYIKNTTIASNQAAIYGGGIHDDPNKSIVLSNVFLIQNSATNHGGGMYTQGSAILTDVTFRQNSTANRGEGLDGGGLYYDNQNDGVELSRVVFDRNTTERNGGGLYYLGYGNEGPTLSDITFVGNTATEWGGGMYIEHAGNFGIARPQLTRLTFKDNQAVRGGGLLYYGAIDGGPDLLSRATFVGNTALQGGGMFVFSVVGVMRDLTMKDNNANSGNSLFFVEGNLEIKNSIFWGSAIGSQISNAPEGGKVSVSTGIVKGGYDYGSNIITSDPLLGALSDNGGFTQTVPLLPGSPAIDQTGTCLDTDQRGVERPQGTACDIGAFENVTGDFGCQQGWLTIPDGSIFGGAGSTTYWSEEGIDTETLAAIGIRVEAPHKLILRAPQVELGELFKVEDNHDPSNPLGGGKLEVIIGPVVCP